MEQAERRAALSNAACVVLHVTGSVDASSKDKIDGLLATNGAAATATLASGA
jgi:hypothetical protein